MVMATIWFKLAGKSSKVNTAKLTTSGALEECRQFCELKVKALDPFSSLDLKSSHFLTNALKLDLEWQAGFQVLIHFFFSVMYDKFLCISISMTFNKQVTNAQNQFT